MNQDGVVDQSDADLLANAWANALPAGANDELAAAGFNFDTNGMNGFTLGDAVFISQNVGDCPPRPPASPPALPPPSASPSPPPNACTLENLQDAKFGGATLPINCVGQTLTSSDDVVLPDMGGDKVDFTSAKLTSDKGIVVQSAVDGKFESASLFAAEAFSYEHVRPAPPPVPPSPSHHVNRMFPPARAAFLRVGRPERRPLPEGLACHEQGV